MDALYRYAEHLYSKGDYDGAAEQFVLTIGEVRLTRARSYASQSPSTPTRAPPTPRQLRPHQSPSAPTRRCPPQA